VTAAKTSGRNRRFGIAGALRGEARDDTVRVNDDDARVK
jgi:hypothetical protein